MSGATGVSPSDMPAVAAEVEIVPLEQVTEVASEVAETVPALSIAIVPDDVSDAEAARLLEERAEADYQQRVREHQYRPPVGAEALGIDNTKSGTMDVVMPHLARHAAWAVPVIAFIMALPLLSALGAVRLGFGVLVWVVARRYRWI